jgi:hypothetical protein
MKKIVIAATLLIFSASAHAGTYSYDGVKVHIGEGCMSSSCVSVYAPGYSYYHGARSAKLHKTHKDNSRIVAAKKDDGIPAQAAPAMEATPAKAPEATPSAAPATAAPATK